MMNGKKHDELSPVPQEFKDGGKGYTSMVEGKIGQ